jgi:aryl-alcohol dehydrogenase-like predicted oxidoreductase
MTLIDTAEMYGSEEFIGRVIAGQRNRVFLDDRFHEAGWKEQAVDWWIPRLRLAERGAASWQDGGMRSSWR